MVGRGAWIVVAVLVALAVGAGVPAGAQDGEGVRFITIATGTTSGMREPAQVIVRDSTAWWALWRRHTQGAGPPLPSVDFGREMVVGVFAGVSPKPARVTIHRITQRSGRLVLWYSIRENRPLPDGDGTPPSTAFHIVRLARSPLPVEFSVLKLPQVY